MTKLTETQTFNRPAFQAQGPDTNCVINGHALGWDSCTAYSTAMGVDGHSGGHYRPSGCTIRRHVGDTTGGLTLPQVAKAVRELYAIDIHCYTGSQVIEPERLAAFIRAGRRSVVQGNAVAMVGSPFQSTSGAVNHAVFVNEVRGGSIDRPAEALVYDPAADGRKRGYHVDQGPSWWPWTQVLEFCAKLQPSGSGPQLGPGKVYAGVFPDSEPHVKLVPGGRRSAPFPDRARANEKAVWIHTNRKKGTKSRKYGVANGTLLVFYQYAPGDSHDGSNLWGGNDDGTEWVHLANCRHVGGET